MLSADNTADTQRRGIKYLLQAAIVSVAFTLPLTASTLETKSPFLPPGHNKPKAQAPVPVRTNGPIARQIEFRGVVQMNETYRLSLFDKSEQKGYWIKVGENKGGINVTAFDPKSMAITLNQNGRSERLNLLESTDAPMPVKISSAPALNSAIVPNLPPGVQKNTGVNNTSKNKRTIPRRRVILPKK